MSPEGLSPIDLRPHFTYLPIESLFMADSDKKTEFQDDQFDPSPNVNLTNTDRKSVRYIRNDIKASLIYSNVLGLKTNRPSELNDISTKGALVTTVQKLSINKKVTVIITFDDGKVFRISGKIIRQCPTAPHRYGIKFEKQENGLGDYLLKTQTDLIFK